MAVFVNPGLKIAHPVGDELLIGRGEDCQIRIERPTVSKHHAKIFFKNERWYVEDLGSSNFTYLNGHKISRSEFSFGDYVRFDLYPMILFDGEAAPKLPEILITDAAGTIRQKLPI